MGVNKGGAIGGRGLNAASVNRLVGEYGAKAGLAPLHGKGRLGPHDLRRTASRNAYDNGGGAVDFVRYANGGAM